ncbi:MAG: class I SAM-dependent methyltransferase [Bacteroidetes bacterium]|nr:MAG: class I SAM-dependent methyltransferase [Bacteroidota bacterium]
MTENLIVREPSYEPDWLEVRYPYDEAARHAGVEAAARAWLARQTPPWQLVDVGAGHGANFRYYLDRLEGAQDWTLVEQDPALVAAARNRILALAAARSWAVEENDGTLALAGGPHPVRVRLVTGSLLELGRWVNLRQTQLVLANAVFDLFTPAQFESFAAELARSQTALFMTLNYTGMDYAPPSRADRLVTGLYEAHMNRPRASGRGMGKYGPEQMAAILQSQGFHLTEGESIWQVPPGHQVMQRFLLGFMGEAIPELPLSPRLRGVFADWLSEKRTQSANDQLKIRVMHMDTLALPHSSVSDF